MRCAGLSLTIVVAVALAGCGQQESPPVEAQATAGHSHDGWWCPEHGVPEEVCALCDNKLVGSFKEKGDWCAQHDRPDSQCFTCHPEREGKFAALYEAKYGKKPPAREME